MAQEKVLSENTVKSYRLSMAQFEKWCEETKVKKVTQKVVSDYLIASQQGYPNGKPKKASALNIKCKGILWCLNEKGNPIEAERGFVNRVLGIGGEEISDDSEGASTPPTKREAKNTRADVRAPRN